MKTRPIDDFSERPVNATNSCKEFTFPTRLDQICSGIVRRHGVRGNEELFGKTIDLRKVYKNLPLSSLSISVLCDSCISVCTRQMPMLL